MNWLLRLFVKNYNDVDTPTVRTAIGSVAGTTGIICNFFLFAAKLVAGLLSGAVSVIADALNNLSDAASSVVTLIGFRLAQRPADKDHPYGHARYEYLSGSIVAVLILLIGFELVKSSVEKIFQPVSPDVSVLTLAILVGSIFVKLWMYFFYSRLGRKISSSALRAAAVDCRNDVIASAAVLLGCIVCRAFCINLDGYIGLAVAIFILYSGVTVARETISPLLGEKADGKLVQQITEVVLSHEKVLGFHDLLVHDYGPGKCYASVHVEISAQEDPMVCHDIIDDIECDILEKLNVNLVIHYDPVLENDEEWNTARQVVTEIVAQLDPDYSIHDFRIVRGANQTKLVFDLAVPYDTQINKKALRSHIEQALAQQGMDYTAVVRFDAK